MLNKIHTILQRVYLFYFAFAFVTCNFKLKSLHNEAQNKFVWEKTRHLLLSKI